jgi:NAD-dependent SIR2 family protein deacetylase
MNLRDRSKVKDDEDDSLELPMAPGCVSSSPSRPTQTEQTAMQTNTPNTKRRRRLRGDVSLENLARSIITEKSVVFISGAGLSVASGVRPFRSGRPEDGSWLQPKKGSEDKRFAAASKTGLQAGLWDQVLWTTATRESFRQDPLKWYNEFWIPHLGSSGLGAKPNAGHHALQHIIKQFPKNCKQITQNIDGLQSDDPHANNKSLIEIHGRAGLYKCLPDSDSDTDSDSDDEEDRPVHLGHRRKTRNLKRRLQDPTLCPYQYLESLAADQLLVPESERYHLAPKKLNSTSDAPCESLKQLSVTPRCPVCRNIVMPQALLFDEGYHSHSFYDFELAEDWLRDCEVMVFCGTSFAVNLTTVALDHARAKEIPVYNFNLHDTLVATARLNVSNIMGPADETLPKLAESIQRIQNEDGQDKLSN